MGDILWAVPVIMSLIALAINVWTYVTVRHHRRVIRDIERAQRRRMMMG